jgi:energy-coupling factor transporter transmembrane protein EcfT
MELRAIKMQQRDMLLHRLLPFGLVLAFLAASTAIALFGSVALGLVGVVSTIGAVVIAYLTGRAPSAK